MKLLMALLFSCMSLYSGYSSDEESQIIPYTTENPRSAYELFDPTISTPSPQPILFIDSDFTFEDRLTHLGALMHLSVRRDNIDLLSASFAEEILTVVNKCPDKMTDYFIRRCIPRVSKWTSPLLFCERFRILVWGLNRCFKSKEFANAFVGTPCLGRCFPFMIRKAIIDLNEDRDNFSKLINLVINSITTHVANCRIGNHLCDTLGAFDLSDARAFTFDELEEAKKIIIDADQAYSKYE